MTTHTIEFRAYTWRAPLEIEGPTLAEALISWCRDERTEGRRPDLANANLMGADLADANLADANLTNANLAKANLTLANLVSANLVSANLAKAYLARASLTGANLTGASLVSANLAGATIDLTGVPRVADLDAAINAAVGNGSGLAMAAWHTCKTTHCRAGWAIHLAGAAGYDLEQRIGSCAAGALIYLASTGRGQVPHFFADDATALADIRRCAALASEVAT